MRSSQAVPLILCAILAALVTNAFAQRTVTNDAGGGRKIVMHYNESDQIVETDTVDSSGKVLQKEVLTRRPGAYAPDTTKTFYWPDGKVRSVTEVRYDDNSNFTGEYAQSFDESGKQTGGHRLTHDPVSNVYVCTGWDTEKQAYKPVTCPAGEESSGTPEQVKKYSADDVAQQLERAHKNASQASSAVRLVGNEGAGLVLPAKVRAGERVSGSIVEDPERYQNNPNVTVTRLQLPSGASLAGWSVSVDGSATQSADGPLSFDVPRGKGEISLVLTPNDKLSAAVTTSVKLPLANEKNVPRKSYLAPATCIKGEPCVVTGSFSGDAGKNFAAVYDQPAKILAEAPDVLYLAIPDSIPPGTQPLVITQGSKAIVFPMVITVLSIDPNRRDLKLGESWIMYVTVDGADDVPDPEWRPGNFPASRLSEARKLIPNYKIPRNKHDKGKHEAAEKGAAQEGEKDEAGEMLLVIKNITPELANFRGAKDGVFTFHLRASAFKMGEFKYKFVIEPKQPGKLGVQAFLFPFLAPIEAQEFTIPPAK